MFHAWYHGIHVTRMFMLMFGTIHSSSIFHTCFMHGSSVSCMKCAETCMLYVFRVGGGVIESSKQGRHHSSLRPCTCIKFICICLQTLPRGHKSPALLEPSTGLCSWFILDHSILQLSNIFPRIDRGSYKYSMLHVVTICNSLS